MKTQAPETTFERREIKYLLTTVQKEAFMGIIEGELRKLSLDESLFWLSE